MKAVRMLIDDDAYARLRVMSHYTDTSVGDLMLRVFDAGIDRWGWGSHSDAPSVFAYWLRLSRGYKRGSANGTATHVRKALRSGQDIDEWMEAPEERSALWRRRACLSLWKEWCALVGHDPQKMEISPTDVEDAFERAEKARVDAEARMGPLDGVR
jgi:hypothetical protein